MACQNIEIESDENLQTADTIPVPSLLCEVKVEDDPGGSISQQSDPERSTPGEEILRVRPLKHSTVLNRGGPMYACDECDYKATRRCYLRIHMRKHRERPYPCDECQYRAIDASALKRHKRTHSGEKPHACDECNYRAVQLFNLKRHMRTHARQRAVSSNE